MSCSGCTMRHFCFSNRKNKYHQECHKISFRDGSAPHTRRKWGQHFPCRYKLPSLKASSLFMIMNEFTLALFLCMINKNENPCRSKGYYNGARSIRVIFPSLFIFRKLISVTRPLFCCAKSANISARNCSASSQLTRACPPPSLFFSKCTAPKTKCL